MSVNIAKEVSALGRLTVKDLRAKHIEDFGEATRSGNKDWLRKRIAWRIQASVEGDPSEHARQRAIKLANDADLRTNAPLDTTAHEARVAPLQLRVNRVCHSRVSRFAMPGLREHHARGQASRTNPGLLDGWVWAPRDTLGVPPFSTRPCHLAGVMLR